MSESLPFRLRNMFSCACKEPAEAADRIEKLEAEVSTARRTSKYWKMEHLEGNKRIEQLELIEKAYEQNQKTWSRNIARIEKLEAALREIIAALRTVKDWHDYGAPPETIRMINAALEGKDD